MKLHFLHPASAPVRNDLKGRKQFCSKPLKLLLLFSVWVSLVLSLHACLRWDTRLDKTLFQFVWILTARSQLKPEVRNKVCSTNFFSCFKISEACYCNEKQQANKPPIFLSYEITLTSVSLWFSDISLMLKFTVYISEPYLAEQRQPWCKPDHGNWKCFYFQFTHYIASISNKKSPKYFCLYFHFAVQPTYIKKKSFFHSEPKHFLLPLSQFVTPGTFFWGADNLTRSLKKELQKFNILITWDTCFKQLKDSTWLRTICIM